jgi:hypothetical protein
MNVPVSAERRPAPTGYPPFDVTVGAMRMTVAQLGDLMLAISTGERGDSGLPELKRALTETEKTMLRQRMSDLGPFLKPAPPQRIKSVLSRCFQSFGYAPASDEEAASILTQYLVVLSGYPEWAIEKAVHRFASGDVRPQEVGARTIDISARPSTAQLRVVVEDIYAPIRSESMRLSMTMAGKVTLKPASAEERERGLASIAAWRAQQVIRMEDQSEAADIRKGSFLQEVQFLHEKRLRREYREAGVEPPDPENLVSLPMLFSMGWTIMQMHDGSKALVKPAAPPPLRRSLGR